MKIVKPYACITQISGGDGVTLMRGIEECARTSYRSEGGQTADSYLTLLPRLFTSAHMSVFEHGSITVEFCVDRGVSHELVRHRLLAFTQECVSGDTRLIGNVTIQDVKVGQRIRSSNGKVIVPNRVAKVFKKGVQPVWQVKTKNGYQIKATLAHEFQTPSKKFLRLDALKVGDSVMVNGRPCLLAINDATLIRAYMIDKLSPLEIAEKYEVPYHTVLARLHKAQVFVKHVNDKNLAKYNSGRTEVSIKKMRQTIIEGYVNGREPWNKGVTESESASVMAQGNALRANHYSNRPLQENSFWKGGVRNIQTSTCVHKLKAHIKACEICKNTKRLEIHHVDENCKNDEPENIAKICRKCHIRLHSKFRIGIKPVADTIVSIKFAGNEEVFDLEMMTHHNYVANGFIVHNSTRYCNYSKEKFDSEIKVIRPATFASVESGLAWELAVLKAEEMYFQMLSNGEKPQIARDVLPTCLATVVRATGNPRVWRHVLLQRTHSGVHPKFLQVSLPLLAEFKTRIPILYDDIEPMGEQSINLRRPQ